MCVGHGCLPEQARTKKARQAAAERWRDLSPGEKNPVLFHKHLVGKKKKKKKPDHKRGSVLEAISEKDF